MFENPWAVVALVILRQTYEIIFSVFQNLNQITLGSALLANSWETKKQKPFPRINDDMLTCWKQIPGGSGHVQTPSSS